LIIFVLGIDDIYQHPDWQFLNEYRDENGHLKDPKQKSKRKINKNVTVKTSKASSYQTIGMFILQIVV
jgi:hypothetical protein